MSFKCCKTKIPSYYVCKSCSGIYHKSCLIKKKSKVTFLTGNTVICCKNDTGSNTDLDDISILEKTISELSEDGLSKEKYIQKLKNEHESFLQDAMRSEHETNEMIKQQNILIDELRKRIQDLQEQIDKNLVYTKTNCTQTSRVESQDKGISTSSEESANSWGVDDMKFNNTSTQTPWSNNASNCRSITKLHSMNTHNTKKNIVLISDQTGRHMAELLKRQTGEKFSVQSFLKPGSSDKQLLNTALDNVRSANANDIIILWLKNYKTNLNTLNEMLINKSPKPHVITITEPYRYDVKFKNRLIYSSNLALKRLLHNLEIPNNFIECNSIIRMSNYKTDGRSLKKSAKWFLCKAIVHNIQTLSQGSREVINIGSHHKHVTTHSVKSTQIEPEHTQHSDKKIVHLYPRLSQISFITDEPGTSSNDYEEQLSLAAELHNAEAGTSVPNSNEDFLFLSQSHANLI